MNLMKGSNKGIGKAQSAMEYLMTYGWAILVIAVVLAALFALGIFNGGTLPTACIAQSGFLCKVSSFSIPNAHSGTLSTMIGQATGTDWVTANIAFLNASQLSTPTASSYWSTAGNIVQFSGGIVTGGEVSASIPVNSLSSNVIGTSVQGQIWAQYTTSVGSGGPYYTEIATVTAKSVS